MLEAERLAKSRFRGIMAFFCPMCGSAVEAVRVRGKRTIFEHGKVLCVANEKWKGKPAQSPWRSKRNVMTRALIHVWKKVFKRGGAEAAHKAHNLKVAGSSPAPATLDFAS